MDEAELKCSNVPYAHDEVAVSPGSLSTQLTNSPAKNIAVAVDAQRDRCLKKYTEKGPALVSRQTVFNSKPIEFKFEGEWLNGSRSGTGKLTTNLPSEYDGEWNKGRRHGRGMQVYPTGNVYKGQWQNDMKSGFGMMKWIDQQQVYEGEWQFDKPDGVGTQVWFRHSCPGFDLRSVESLADCQRQVTLCNRYKGEFKNGQRHGQGKFLYSNGAVYSGCWAHNLKHGPGIFIHINGQVQKGIWNNDILDEEGHSSRNTCSDQPKLMLDYHVECDDLFPTKHAGSSLPESELISTVLLRNNDHLRRIVAFYESCEDVMVPRMKLCNLWTLIRDCNLRSASLTRAQISSMFTSYNMDSLHPHDGYRVILFRELHEILVRISATILCNQAADHLSDALKVLVQNIIIPRFEICVKAIENNQCRKSLEVLKCLAPFEETLRSLFKRLQARQTFTVPSRTLFQCLLKNGVTSKDILQSFNDAYRCDLTDDNDLVVKALDLASDEVLFEEFIEIIGRSFKSLSTSSSNEADISNWIGALQDFQI